MTINVSTKIRAIGGASALALSVSLTGAALAQTAPGPLVAAPTPTAPVAPGNAEECAVITGILTCAPGTDADGFFDLSDDPLGIDVQAGSVVQGPIIVTGTVVGVVDGSVQTGGDGDGGLLIGADSDVTIGGFVQTTGQFSVALEAGANSQIANNGTIYTSGDNFSDAVSLSEGATFTNTGLVQTDGTESFGIFGAGNDITIVNTDTGTIVTSGEASFGIAVLDGANIQNDGLIQTFGDFAIGVDTQENGTVINNGNIVTSGASSFGVGMRNDASFTNGANGLISTSGDEARGVSVLLRGTLVNDGTIETSGEEAEAVYALADANITNNGTIMTTGDNLSDAVTVRDNGVITNNGLIQTDGAESSGIFGFGDNISVTNTAAGEITANGIASFGVLALDGANVINDGLIQTGGDFGIAVDVQNDGTIVNNGDILTTGIFSYGVGARDNSAFTNGADGLVSTTGDDARAVTMLIGATIINDGTVQTTGEAANGIRALADANLTNNGSIITTGGDAADAVEIRDNSVVTNTGLIQTSGESSIGVFGRGDGITLTNGAAGEIITAGDGGFAVSLENDGTVQNDGLIQTSGLGGIGIDALNGADVVNSGSIVTSGDLARGVTMLDNGIFTNTQTGTVSAAGDALAAVRVGASSIVENDGVIETTGDDAIAILAGDAAAVTLTASSSVTTQGEFSGAVFVNGTGDVSNAGAIETLGEGAQAVTITGAGTVTNSGTITAALARGVDVNGLGTVTNTASGSITSADDDAIRFGTDGSSLDNAGTITSTGGFAFAVNADGLNDISIVNSGTISTSADSFIAVLAGDNLNVSNSGSIASFFVGVSAGNGLILDNAAAGSITSQDGPAVAAGDGAVITNAGTIESGAANAIESGASGDTVTLTNSGTIAAGAGGAGAVFDNGSITNASGASITGDIAGISSPGAGTLTIVNSGSITGLSGDAVLLGDGNGSFTQNAGASVTGNVNLAGGDDTFILASSASSIAGIIDGGMGTDNAILSGNLDADNITGFENTSLGAQGDLRVTGNRTLQGDVTIDGNVILGLGVDTLTTTGAMVLEQGGTLTIETPLDVALVGQTVLVLQDGTGFTDNGGTINIIDDDLLVDYVPVIGSLSVQVNAVNQLITSEDSNLITFGAAVTTALNSGTLSQANFDLINDLPDASAYEALALDALPSLSGGAAREIFETSSAASDALNRHLMGDTSGVWGEFILRGAEQDALSPTAGGYESDQTIFTVGGDFVFGELGRIGLLASYAEIENEDLTRGVARGRTDAQSIKVGAYAATTFAERGFWNAEIAYLSGDIDEGRSGVLGGVNSSYEFSGFAYRAVAGFDILPDENFALTPSVGINGASLSFDDASELGGFGLNVARDDADFMELRGAVELSGQMSDRVSGFVRGTVIHDLEDGARSFDLASADLGTFTVVLPEREKNRFELAAGASVDVSENFAIEVGYLGDFADGYDGHSAQVTARIAF